MKRDAVELGGLRRRDAAILIAAALKPEDVKPFNWLYRTFVVRRFGVKNALVRLEARGLIEPGWTVTTRRKFPVRARPTAEGRRVARAAAVTLELEDFAGPA